MSGNFNAPPLEPGSGSFGRQRSVLAQAGATGAAHGTVKSYLIGFALSVLLTALPFALVMVPGVSHSTAVAGVLSMAVVQVFVHLIYFLHMNGASEQRWNVFAFAFTMVIVLIVISGSVWIMNHLTTNLHHRVDNEAVIPQR